MVRVLLSLLVLILTFTTSGLSSAIAAATAETHEQGDACCADGDERDAPQSPTDEDRDSCPPFCHSCACSPALAMPVVLARVIAVSSVELPAIASLPSQPHAGPPGPRVFHPPRS